MKTGMFETSPGNTSSTRIMFVIGLVWSMLFVSIFAFVVKPPISVGEIVALFGGLSGPFFALKLIQKPMEKKDEAITGDLKPDNQNV